MRDPSTADLVAYVCNIQPELDQDAAAALLHLDSDLWEWIAERWHEQRITAQSLLNLHIDRAAGAAA